MTPKSGPKEARAQRADRIAYWRLRGLSIREITKKLAEEGITRPNGAPWSHMTVKKDLDKLETQWQERAARTTATHKANQIAEIREARRVAWARVKATKEGDLYSHEDIGEIRRLLELEAKILGTNAPEQSIVGGMEDRPLMIKGYKTVSPEDWD